MSTPARRTGTSPTRSAGRGAVSPNGRGRTSPPRGAPRPAFNTGAAVEEVKQDVANLDALASEGRNLSRSYSAQAAALKRDLALVQRQIEFERERRREVERLSEAERVGSMPSEHVEAIARRDEDIRAVEEEKASMMEWLRRGVTEAQTISLDCEKMREKAESSHLTQAELRAERDRLENMERRLTSEVAEAVGKIKRLQDSSSALEEHRDHQHSLLGVTSDITASARADRDRLRGDVDQLQQRAREVETIEISVGCMAATVRRTLHTLETLQASAEAGTLAANMDDEIDNDGYDSDEDADGTKITPVVLSSTKAKIGRCEALLLTMHSTLKRFSHDETSRQGRFKAEFEEEMRAAQDHLAAFERQCGGELAELEAIVAKREPQLRTAIELRDAAMRSDAAQFGPLAGESNFSLDEYYEIENARLALELQQLRSDNESLTNKAQGLDGDYQAVRALRREYRELEAKKLALSQTLRKEEEDQRGMKLQLNDTTATGKSSPSRQQKRAPWRATSTY